MKATGIVRRMDELGRVVIPKEIRESLNIVVGEALEVCISKTAKGQPMVCFAKYSTNFENDLMILTTQIANSLDIAGEYDLSDKFRDVIKEAAEILKEFEKNS